MAETAEIPEAKDPFERRVALTIAVLAALLAVVSMVGDNAKLEGILSATQASNQWAYYQAKSIKEHTYQLGRDTLQVMSGADEARRQEMMARYEKEALRYGREKQDIQAKAEELQRKVVEANRANDRCDLATLQLQVAIVLGSVGILVRWRAFWYLAIALGVTGLVTVAPVFLR